MNLPLGQALPNWQRPAFPPAQPMDGRYCRLEPLDPDKHTEDLFAANAVDTDGANWTYLPYGPFVDSDEYQQWVTTMASAVCSIFSWPMSWWPPYASCIHWTPAMTSRAASMCSRR